MNIIRDIAIVTFIICLGVSNLFAQSLAHTSSAYAIIDPTYSSEKKVPRSGLKNDGAFWIYGSAELECWRLQLLMQRKDSAKLLVGYPGVFHKPYTDVSFRLILKDEILLESIEFRAVGKGQVFINEGQIDEFSETDSIHLILPEKNIGIKKIEFYISSKNDLPALLVDNEKLSVFNNSWQWKSEMENWQLASVFPQTATDVPPHNLENPTINLKLVSEKDGLFDFGKELFGYIIIRNQQKPKMFIGESEAEAMDTINKILEQPLEMVEILQGEWRSKNPMAFRYIFINNSSIQEVSCKAIFQPAIYRGAFACSDSTLTRIWMNSAYTLRMCMHDFLLDGIKRDRLPWTGDLAMSMLVNAYTFYEPELVRRSLVALGREGIKEKDINGIIDYSLWWVIAQDLYQLYYGDKTHLDQQWSKITETLHFMENRCDSLGFIKPENTWLFIDWVEQEKWTALQILWWWTQESAAKLAHRMGNREAENYWQNNSDKLKNKLLKHAWSEDQQLWFSSLNPLSKKTRHPNFLAIISGLAPDKQFKGIRNLLENDKICPVGTPYMAGFENMALARLGNIQFMLDNVKEYWGGMLKLGATTFWEAYDKNQKGSEHYEFYKRPYAKSLCHAWSAGPAAFLPSEIFGLKPLDDGWRRFSINPDLGDLKWAYVSVPTKFGNIVVNIKNKKIEINVPNKVTLEWNGKSIKGPMLIQDTIK